MTQRIEGYWRTPHAPELPIPAPESDWLERTAFLLALTTMETIAFGRQSKGFSSCRICGCVNGSVEFELDEWKWPDGLIHYIREHDVRPSPDFEKFILAHQRVPAHP